LQFVLPAKGAAALRLIAGTSNLTDEKYYDRVFANGIEPRTASLRLRWCIPGILTGPGAGENNGS